MLSRSQPLANFPLYTSDFAGRATTACDKNTLQSNIYHPNKENIQTHAIMSEATPRITAPYLEQFSHQTVRILGKVRQLRGEQATIDAGGQISVFLNRVR